MTFTNLVFNQDSNFFKEDIQNEFSKLKLNLTITNMLDVKVEAESELYFNKSYQEDEVKGSNSFKIQTSYFLITEKPKIRKLDYNI